MRTPEHHTEWIDYGSVIGYDREDIRFRCKKENVGDRSLAIHEIILIIYKDSKRFDPGVTIQATNTTLILNILI